MSRNDKIHLSEIIAKVHLFTTQAEQAFDILVSHRAAKLALNLGEEFDARQRELLQGAADGELSWSDLDARGLEGAKKQNRAYRAVVEQIGEAEGQLREEEMDRLGMAAWREPLPWQRVEQFIMTRSQIPVDDDALEGYAADAALKSFSETTAVSTEIARLHDSGVTEQLLQDLWSHCPQDAKRIGLPELENGTVTTKRRKREDDEITLAEAEREFDVPSYALSRAAQKEPGSATHLPTRKDGSNVLVHRRDARAFADNYDARRERREVGSLSRDGSNLIAQLRKTAQPKKKSIPRKSLPRR